MPAVSSGLRSSLLRPQRRHRGKRRAASTAEASFEMCLLIPQQPAAARRFDGGQQTDAAACPAVVHEPKQAFILAAVEVGDKQPKQSYFQAPIDNHTA